MSTFSLYNTIFLKCRQVDWCEMAFELKTIKKLENYSLALSLCTILIIWPSWFSVSFYKDVKIDDNLEQSFIR